MPLTEITLGKLFLNPEALKLLYFLIPLLIIYLVKPKPKKKNIPSILFFMNDKNKSFLNSFLKKFFTDNILLLQILIIILIALTCAQPFVETTKSVSGEEVVLIIDGSASSQTKFEGGTRFDEQISIAQNNLGKTNTIILAGGVPKIIAEKVSKSEASEQLDLLMPEDTPTNLYDSMMLASGYVSEGIIMVISDFIDDGDMNIITAKNLLESSGSSVVFKQVFSKANNIGITSLEVTEDSCSVVIKNFNQESCDTILKIGNIQKELTINAKDSEVVSFTTPTITSKIVLENNCKDDLNVDDEAFIAYPKNRKINVLLLTNNQPQYLVTALELMEHVNLEISNPPKIPDPENYDVVIISNIQKSLLLPGSIRDIKKSVEMGNSLIITPQNDLFEIDWQGLLPVSYNGVKTAGLVNKITQTPFTKDITFGTIGKHFDVNSNGATVVESDTGVPLVVLSKLGGSVLYYGIFDDDSDFKFGMYYPIFWQRVLEYVTDQKQISSLNFLTGDIAYMNSPTKLPNNIRVPDKRLILSQAGVYVSDDEEFVASLTNERESDINGESVSESSSGIKSTTITEQEKKTFTTPLLIIILLLIFLEIYLVRRRGDF